MQSSLSVITIGIDPTIKLGPVTLTWHGLTIAVGIVIGGLAATQAARERRLDAERMVTLGATLAGSAVVGGRLFYLAEHGEPADPGRWMGTTGFTFDGGFIAAAIGIALYLRLSRSSIE